MEKERDCIVKRVEVFWPQDDVYYPGKVTKKRKLRKRLRHEYLIEYDDGEKEWVDLDNNDPNIRFTNKSFRLEQDTLKNQASKLKINSRVFVWWPLEKTYFPGIVNNIREGFGANSRPHHIQYDDGDEEWTNLNYRKFKFQDEESSSSGTYNPLCRETSESGGDNQVDRGPSCEEICGICNKKVKRPRATSCHHIFCKVCIKASSRKMGKKCPICHVRIESKLKKYDSDDDSYRGVEALDMNTAEIVFRFKTASAASLEIDNLKPFHVIEASKSLRRDDQQCGGYYWRFKDSKRMILKTGEGVKEGILPFGQTHLKTHLQRVQKTIQIRRGKGGEVIKEFESSREAQKFIHEEHNADYCWSSICRWCREEKYELGFHWQYKLIQASINIPAAQLGKRLIVLQTHKELIEGKLISYDFDTREYEIEFLCGRRENHRLEHITYEFKSNHGQKPA